MNNKEIRWKQRFQNYTRSLDSLQRAVEIKNPSEIERGGLIQFFEISFELAWKTLKDYLESEGFLINSPRELFSTEVRNKFYLPTSSTLSTNINGLITKDLIYKSEKGYLIANPVFEFWIKSLN